MKKNVEWLKEEVEKDIEFKHYVSREHILGLIDQLDEPETLSQKWINNHTASAYTIAHYSEEDVPVVTVSDLQNLLVPKLNLPVIPDYVANFFIEVFGSEHGDHPESNTVYNFISNFEGGYGFGDEEKVRKWYFRNIENKQKFEKAWLLKDWIVDNRKYRIKFGKEKYGVRFDKKKLEATLFEKEKSSVFTEDEIFELEQGRLFWRNFAVPVDGLEE